MRDPEKFLFELNNAHKSMYYYIEDQTLKIMVKNVCLDECVDLYLFLTKNNEYYNIGYGQENIYHEWILFTVEDIGDFHDFIIATEEHADGEEVVFDQTILFTGVLKADESAHTSLSSYTFELQFDETVNHYNVNIPTWIGTKTFNYLNLCIRGDKLYQCQANGVTGAWDPSKWRMIDALESSTLDIDAGFAHGSSVDLKEQAATSAVTQSDGLFDVKITANRGLNKLSNGNLIVDTQTPTSATNKVASIADLSDVSVAIDNITIKKNTQDEIYVDTNTTATNTNKIATMTDLDNVEVDIDNVTIKENTDGKIYVDTRTPATASNKIATMSDVTGQQLVVQYNPSTHYQYGTLIYGTYVMESGQQTSKYVRVYQLEGITTPAGDFTTFINSTISNYRYFNEREFETVCEDLTTLFTE